MPSRNFGKSAGRQVGRSGCWQQISAHKDVRSPERKIVSLEGRAPARPKFSAHKDVRLPKRKIFHNDLDNFQTTVAHKGRRYLQFGVTGQGSAVRQFGRLVIGKLVIGKLVIDKLVIVELVIGKLVIGELTIVSAYIPRPSSR